MRTLTIPALVLAAFAAFSPPALARTHTLDAMIGQMLLVGFNGTSPDGKIVRRVTRQIAAGQIGGVILFDRNIRSPAQVRAMNAKFLNTGHPLTPFVSVDQEGGSVQRLSRKRGFKGFPTAQSIARRYTPDQARKIYKTMALELASAGFNLNFGPVVDLNLNRRNPIIGRLGRSFGDDPKRVTAFAKAFISAHQEVNILTSLKHFPGHGSSATDSHKGFVDITKTWKAVELDPYRMLAREGAIDSIMVGHLYHAALSGNARLPATLSRTAIEGWIRGKIGFQGVVITDDLEMAAIRKYHNLRTTLIKAVLSGNDILMFSSSGSDPKFVSKATQILRDAVLDGTIPRARIEQAHARISALKQRLRPSASVQAVPAGRLNRWREALRAKLRSYLPQ